MEVRQGSVNCIMRSGYRWLIKDTARRCIESWDFEPMAGMSNLLICGLDCCYEGSCVGCQIATRLDSEGAEGEGVINAARAIESTVDSSLPTSLR